MDDKYIMGVFETEESLLAAFRKMKEEQIEIEDVFTPYPARCIMSQREA